MPERTVRENWRCWGLTAYKVGAAQAAKDQPSRPKAARTTTATRAQEPPAETPELTPAEAKRQARTRKRREDYWTRKVNAASNKAVAGIIETGNIFIQAQVDLPSGTWTAWVEGNLKWTIRTVQQFQKIGEYEPFHNKETQKKLPASWGTLAVLTRLEPEELAQAIKDGVITPATERKDADKLVKQLHPKPGKDEPENYGESEPGTADAVEGSEPLAIEDFPRFVPLAKAATDLQKLAEMLAKEAQSLLDNRELHADEILASQAADRISGLIDLVTKYVESTDTDMPAKAA